ncbi:hypothetical protein E2553_38860 [Paraburkholderia dipogonis]|uniref:MarR family transcriptional regulator n=1 Tax=Paraburkholderia dipogonis TaxID=1211383 RepID=A0A4Y8MIY8_9BURK|nr:hypothetical protein [Paraburkholderia dipogonis]TFE37436.1 hypothetical protein E2553_38860 [Paraburkholderia dipogonis]
MGAATPPTNKDAEYLGRLQDYFADNRRILSMSRIAEVMGFASKAASKRLMERLEVAGCIQRTPDDDAWIPSNRFFERTLADSAVRAARRT